MTTLTDSKLSLNDIKLLITCCYKETTKQALQYVYFDGVTATSVDGHRVYSVPYIHNEKPFLIKGSDLKTIIKGSKKHDYFTIGVNSPDKRMESDIGKFPQVELLLPQAAKHHLLIDPMLEPKLANAINDVSMTYVALQVKDKIIQITHGYQTESRDFRWLGNPLELELGYPNNVDSIVFLQKYISDLATVSFNRIEITDNKSPVVFHGQGGNYLLLMPFCSTTKERLNPFAQ